MFDDLLRYRDQFPITEHYAFLSHSAVSPMSRPVAAALQQHIAQVQTHHFLDVFPAMLEQWADLKRRIVQLINAHSSDEIVMMPNTAMGINTAAVSLPLQPGDNVLVLDGDYPANTYPWQNLTYRGILTKFVPQHNGGLDLELLRRRIDSRTRVIALSTAMFATGFRNDIAAVGALCQEHGIFFVVDAIQTLGAFPLDVQACHIDMLACGSQKWLMSTPGYGFFYCRDSLLDQLQPGAYVGAASVSDPQNYLDYNFTLLPNADRFNLGTPNLSGMVAMHAAIGLLQEVGIERISQRVLHLVDTLITDLADRGYRCVADTAPAHRSGIVVVDVAGADDLARRMQQEGIIVTSRGTGLRVAPHFYNTEADVLRVGELLTAWGAQ
jgi:selenocysteine lyase/cysteine desulfurase